MWVPVAARPGCSPKANRYTAFTYLFTKLHRPKLLASFRRVFLCMQLPILCIGLHVWHYVCTLRRMYRPIISHFYFLPSFKIGAYRACALCPIFLLVIAWSLCYSCPAYGARSFAAADVVAMTSLLLGRHNKNNSGGGYFTLSVIISSNFPIFS